MTDDSREFFNGLDDLLRKLKINDTTTLTINNNGIETIEKKTYKGGKVIATSKSLGEQK